MNEFFDLVRPIIEFSFDTVLARSNNIFEVMTNEPIEALLKAGGVAINTSQQEDEDDMGESAFSHFCKKNLCKNAKIKTPMFYIKIAKNGLKIEEKCQKMSKKFSFSDKIEFLRFF